MLTTIVCSLRFAPAAVLSRAEPMMHVTCTAVGFCVGYLAHRYEENSEQRVQKLMEKHRHVPPHDNWTQMARKERERESAAAH